MRKEKQFLLDDIRDQIEKSGSFIIMRYFKLKSNKANEFRGEVAKLGGSVEMMRKRILIKAAKEAGVELSLNDLDGHIGLVFGGEDPLETTKAVFKFSKGADKAIQVIGGRFEGKLYGAEQVEKLSNLPNLKEMQAQFLSVLEAPMSNTLAVMEALLTSVIYCMDNKVKESSDQ